MKEYYILVVVLNKFNDKKESVHRNRGDFFKCTKERYEEIMKYDQSLIKAVPNEEDIPDPVGDTPDSDGTQAPNNTDSQNLDGSEAVCDIAQMSDEELLQFAKDKKIKNASKMSREQLIEALQ